MRRGLAVGVFLAALAILTTIGYTVLTQRAARRIQTKVARVQAGMDVWTGSGKDPLPIVSILQNVMPALDRHDPRTAEAILDRALELLGPNAPAVPPPPPAPGLPAFTGHEASSDLYINPQPVTIEGYTDNAMEPFISPDGLTLFFNNSNDPKVDTNLHIATRTGPRTFRYAGELAGANSRVLDAAASIDTAGHVYFTSVRQYKRDLRSIFTGTFDGHDLRDVHVVMGTLTPVLPGAINMDVSISPDGETMYISRAKFAEGVPLPLKSDLVLARRQGDEFAIEPRSGELMANINSPALEYAPAISPDGLELYFTRASKDRVRIMVARRSRPDAPFDEPRVLDALSGFVEAPSLSLDTREMFFHEKVDGRFVIYHADRRP